MTISAFGLGLTQIVFAANFLYSLVLGPKAPPNPWKSNTLEWLTESPPPYYNFRTLPTVYHPAYEYSVPGVVGDFLPQTEPRPPIAGPMDPIMA
jgi:cytochrome c oxidase subunit 1